jgi:hypothetical protein
VFVGLTSHRSPVRCTILQILSDLPNPSRSISHQRQPLQGGEVGIGGVLAEARSESLRRPTCHQVTGKDWKGFIFCFPE